ncbi:MAG: TonB-dependent receptor domain-containing protein, partial [Gemmatimonadales bacterium]
GHATATIDFHGPTLTAGIEAQSLRDNRTNRRSINGARTDTLLLDQQERVAEEAAFATIAWPLTTALTVRGGARRDINRFSVTDHFLADGDASGSRTMQATSGSGGIALRLGDNAVAWSDVATVFETPTTTELANRPDGAGGFNPELGPQRSVTEEVGVRAAAGRLTIDVAGYHTTTHDAIIPYSEVAGRTYYRNAGRTRTLGAEAGLAWRLAPGLTARGTFTWTDAAFAEYRAVTPASIDILDGNQVAGFPRTIARLGVAGAIGHGFEIDVDQAFSSGMFADDANTIQVSGWGTGVTGARLLWRGHSGIWDVTPFVAVLNLFDRRYVGAVTINGTGGRVLEPAAGRTISAGISLTAMGR